MAGTDGTGGTDGVDGANLANPTRPAVQPAAGGAPRAGTDTGVAAELNTVMTLCNTLCVDGSKCQLG